MWLILFGLPHQPLLLCILKRDLMAQLARAASWMGLRGRLESSAFANGDKTSVGVSHTSGADGVAEEKTRNAGTKEPGL